MNTSAAATAAASTTRTGAETVPAAWSAADETFFRVVRDLFAPSYLLGASVLLASYDADPGPA